MTSRATGSTPDLPRCLHCGYVIEGLPEPRCPECGTSFDANLVADAAKRHVLLAWERLELGGPARRLWRTWVGACVRPWAHFARTAERSEQPIARAGRLIWWTVLAGALANVAGRGVGACFFAARLYWLHGDAGRAFGLAVHNARLGVPSDAVFTFAQLATPFLSLWLWAYLLRRLFPTRIGSLGAAGLTALLSPTALLLQFFYMLPGLIADLVMELFYWPLLAIPAYLLLTAWCCCRRLLGASIGKSVGMVVALLVMFHVIGACVFGLCQVILVSSYG